jgi:hypothetical protein
MPFTILSAYYFIGHYMFQPEWPPEGVHVIVDNPAMEFRRFNPLCPQKTYYGAMFLNGAITELSGHTSTLVAPSHVTKRWNAARG